MRHVKFNNNSPVWTIEDLTEYVVYASRSKKDLLTYIENNSTKLEGGKYIVCLYPSSRSIIPDSVKTMRRFILDNKIKKTWHPRNLIRNLIGV